MLDAFATDKKRDMQCIHPLSELHQFQKIIMKTRKCTTHAKAKKSQCPMNFQINNEYTDELFGSVHLEECLNFLTIDRGCKLST